MRKSQGANNAMNRFFFIVTVRHFPKSASYLQLGYFFQQVDLCARSLIDKSCWEQVSYDFFFLGEQTTISSVLLSIMDNWLVLVSSDMVKTASLA